jgi:hypothetical protein
VPSDLVIVPMSLALALPAAVAVPVVVTGGHAPAQAPLQLDMSPVSFTHRYTALPEPLVKTVPAEDVAVVMTVPPDAAAPLPAGDAAAGDPVAEAAGAAAVLLAALLQAATVVAAASAPPTPATSLVRLDMALNLDLPISVISHPAQSPAPASRKSLSIEVRAARQEGLFVDRSTRYDLGH